MALAVIETLYVLNVRRALVAIVLIGGLGCRADDARDRTQASEPVATTPATGSAMSRPPESVPAPPASEALPPPAPATPSRDQVAVARGETKPAVQPPRAETPRDVTTKDTVPAPRGDTKAPAASGPLCLELSTSRTRVLLGEPLTLVVTLENCSGAPMRVRDLLAPDYGLLAVWMRRPGDASEALYQTAVRREGRGTKSIDLAPAERVSVTVPVYFGRDGWNLTEPGEYAFRAEYAILGLELHSQPLRVRIEAPQDPAARAAAQQFMSPEAARFFFLEGGDPKGEEVLRSISERHADTPWGSYARLALAIDAAAEKGAQSESCNAVERATAAVRDWPVAMRGYRALASCLRASGQADRAEAMLQEMARKHPEAKSVR